MRGIDLLLERKLPLQLKSVILTENAHELEEMKSFATDLGLKFRFDAELTARVDGGLSPLAYRLSPPTVAHLDRSDPERFKGWKDLRRRIEGADPRSDYVYKCGAAVTSFFVDPCGRLSACIMSRDPSYDLYSRSFQESWNLLVLAIRGLRASKQTPCTHCNLSWLCGVCPGRSRMENGDPEAHIEYFCKIGHIRAEMLGISHEQQE